MQRPQATYEIRLAGHLDQRWAGWFDGLALTREPDGTTVLTGEVADQAALHGLLHKVRDLGLPLVSVRPAPDDAPHPEETAMSPSPPTPSRLSPTALVRRVGDASAARPFRVLAAWLVLAALVAALAGTVGGSFTDDFTAPHSDSARAARLLQARFPAAAGGSAVAVFAAPQGQTLAAARPAVAAALARVADLPHVTGVGDPFTTGGLSADGRTGRAEITLDLPSVQLGRPAAAAMVAALRPARDAGVVAELGGEAAFLNGPKQSGAEGIGLLAALVVLVVAFGSVVAALVPIALALVAVGVGLGAVALLAATVDVSTAAPTFGAMIGLGVGIDYALFLVARYRDARATGSPNRLALSEAVARSGTAVLFAGSTVVLSMGALALTGVGFLTTIGLATSLVVLVAVAAALTLLPALLSLLGDRLDAARVPGRRRTPRAVEDTAWWRLAHRVTGRPWPYAVAATLLLLLLAAPALSLRTGFPNAGDDPAGRTDRRAYDLLVAGFGPGADAPLLVVADLRRTPVAGLPALAARLAADPGLSSVGTPVVSPAGDTAVLRAVPAAGPSDAATARTLARVRAAAPDGVLVTGPTAVTLDLDRQLSRSLPLFVGAILATSFLLLLVVFRSVAVPLKAAAMNLLSIGGAYGVVVAVFQWGWLAGLFGLHQTVLVASPFPLLFFAVLFGLSMDYEVFLVSRVREAYVETGSTTESVARGLAATGRVITSGALVMVVVFLSFVTDPSPFVKMIGLGLAAAIALDATVVRMVLVPAMMALLGRANWWLPGWLDRLLPDLQPQPAVGTAPVPSPRQPEVPLAPVVTG